MIPTQLEDIGRKVRIIGKDDDRVYLLESVYRDAGNLRAILLQLEPFSPGKVDYDLGLIELLPA